MKIKLLCIALTLVFAAGGVWAGTISLNFSENSDNQPFAGGALIGPLKTDSTYWNTTDTRATGDLITGTKTGLIDQTGTDTGASVEWDCSGTYWNNDGTGDDEHKLSVGYLDDWDSGNGNGPVITFSNVPYSVYRVYVLIATDQNQGSTPPTFQYRNCRINGEWAFGGDASTTATAYGTINNNNTNNGEWWTEIVPGVKTGNYFTYVASGSTLSIVSQRNSGTQRGCITAVVIEELFVARSPDPANGALDVALDKVLTWTASTDPNTTGHYVFFAENEALVTARDASVYRGLKAKGNESYNPADSGISLEKDKEYFWVIDESVNGSGPTDPNTILGMVWSFRSIRTLPDITSHPENVTTVEGMDATFSTAAINPLTGDASGLSYAWKAVGDPAVLSTEPVLTLYSVTAASEKQYYCTITNATGPKDTNPATLSISKKVVFWQFNETAGSTASDSSGNGIAGTVGTNAVWSANNGHSGDTGDNALYLPGDPNAFVKALDVDLTGKPVDDIFKGTSSWTINLWVKFEGKPALTNIAGFGDCDGTGADESEADATDRYFASWTDGSLEFELGTDGFWPGTALIDGDWQMLTLSYDAAAKTGVMYFNGDAVSTKTGLTLADTTENAFKINSGLLVVYGGVPSQLKGWVDDFCVFDGPLTAADVEYLYAGYFCPVTPEYDVNGDCVLDMADLLDVLDNWLDCALAPTSACP
ncbi:MAG: hypothetical protein JXB18_14240 [Sedimentisphaerales bacterium]|nr:hypothetical protein [Sedimentisphaerales bacterium]